MSYRSLRALKEYVDSLFPVSTTGTQTLTNKTLTAPVVTAPDLTLSSEAAITTASADVTLSAAQAKKFILEVTTGHNTNAIIAPSTANKAFMVVNNDASNPVLIKKTGGTAVTIPASTSAIVYYNGTEYVMVACNQVTLTGTETMTNKTLTVPTITSPALTFSNEAAIDLGSGDVTLDASQIKKFILEVTTGHAANAIVAPSTTGKAYIVVNNDAVNNALIKKSGGTAVTIPPSYSGLVYYNGTQYVLVASNQVSLDATETLTNKTLTAPTITSPNTTQGQSTHDYEGGAVDWTLSAAELKTQIITVSNSSGAVNAIATPTTGRVYIVYNGTGSNLTFKAAGQTGVVIATTKTAIVRANGTDFVRCTADS